MLFRFNILLRRIILVKLFSFSRGGEKRPGAACHPQIRRQNLHSRHKVPEARVPRRKIYWAYIFGEKPYPKIRFSRAYFKFSHHFLNHKGTETQRFTKGFFFASPLLCARCVKLLEPQRHGDTKVHKRFSLRSLLPLHLCVKIKYPLFCRRGCFSY